MLGTLLKAAFRSHDYQFFTRTDPQPDCKHTWIESIAYTICGSPSVRKTILRCTTCHTRRHDEQIDGQAPETILYSKGYNRA